MGLQRASFVVLAALLALGEASADVAINEIRIDQPGNDNDEYFELFGPADGPLEGLTYLVIGDGTGVSGVIEAVVDLGGRSVGGDGVFLAAEATLTLGTADFVTALNFENGDNVTHLLVSGFSGANGQDLDLDDDGVLDNTPWTTVVDSVALVQTLNGGDRVYSTTVVGPDGGFVPGHALRCPDGGSWLIGSFDLSANDTPGTGNLCEAPAPQITRIHAIQGSGGDSPLVGTTVTVEAIVVGDFQNNGEADAGDLAGFYLQERDADVDGDPATSEGIFVYDRDGLVDVAPGDRVRVTGTVSEYFGLTQIGAQSVEVIGQEALPAPKNLTLPVAAIADLEAFEGMRVRLSQALVIAEYFNFDRYGEIVLAQPLPGEDRPYTPTAVELPGSVEAAARADINLRSRITLDDGRTTQNPDPARHPNGAEFTRDNLFRGGDTVSDVLGVLDYRFSLYRVQPTQGANHVAANPRPLTPDAVGGRLKVASFNVLNYFITLDQGGNLCGPPGYEQECRGADDAEEFERQRAKIIAALAEIDADVVGLVEIENDGGAAIADLVAGLNDTLGAGTYAYVPAGYVGTDAIAVGLIYKPASVDLRGPFAILDAPEFVDPNVTGEPKNRAALAQTFVDPATGGAVTIAVNHLKSKGSECGVGDDDPEQGNCNLTRTLAARVLADWLRSDPTGSGDPDFLIVGDLNAYDKEDPIASLQADGYTDLIGYFRGEYAYSYVFDGQFGYLDYSMANAPLTPQVMGASAWHTNADEPDILDYDTSFKQDAQDALYAPDAYCASDHDPVIVGLDLNGPPDCAAALPSRDLLWPPNHRFEKVRVEGVSDPDGDAVTVSVTSVFQDEPVSGRRDGRTAPDALIWGSGAKLRAEREGRGNGRVYHVAFEATDRSGNTCRGEVTVGVPADRGRRGEPVDDGAIYDSTRP